MNVATYRELKASLKERKKKFRQICVECWQPEFSCFCAQVETFDPKIEFVILIHPLEARKRVATGRMAFLALETAHISRGTDFKNCPKVNRLLSETTHQNIILAKGPGAMNLTEMRDQDRTAHFATGKTLRVFVIDGTWTNAGKMLSRSPNLASLPRYCFTPAAPSNIRVRKQPSPTCLSTLEAIHHTIELLGPSQGFDLSKRTHDKLLKPFQWMVNSRHVSKMERLLKKSPAN